MAKKSAPKKTVETLTHDADKRKNIPTAEFQSVIREERQTPVRLAYERRNRDLDPQLRQFGRLSVAQGVIVAAVRGIRRIGQGSSLPGNGIVSILFDGLTRTLRVSPVSVECCWRDARMRLENQRARFATWEDRVR